MDQNDALKILQNYGAPPTARNLQLVMDQVGASGNSAVLGRSMGLQGGADESGYDDSILRSKLDKLDTASQRVPAQTANVQADTPNPQPPAAKAPLNTTPRNAAPVTPEGTGFVNTSKAAAANTGVMPDTNEVSLLDKLATMLGISGAGAMAKIAGRNISDAISSGRRVVEPTELEQIGRTATEGDPRLAGYGNRPMQPQNIHEAPRPNLKMGGPVNDASAGVMKQSDTGGIKPPVANNENPVSGTPADRIGNSDPINAPETAGRRSDLVGTPTNIDAPNLPPGTGYEGRPTNLIQEVAKNARRIRR